MPWELLFYVVRKLCAIKLHQMHNAPYVVVSVSEGTEQIPTLQHQVLRGFADRSFLGLHYYR